MKADKSPMSIPSWKSKFQQPITGFDPLEAQGLSELGYALRKNQIPEAEYLNWARENFELASLDMKFFQETQPSKELYEKVKDTYAWGPECLPVAEWDDHLLVVCLQKPDDVVPPELKPIFILAPIAGLVKFWSAYTDESSESVFDEQKEDVGGLLEGINIDTDFTKTNQTSLSFSGIGLAIGGETPQPKPVPKVETTATPIVLSEIMPEVLAAPTPPVPPVPQVPQVPEPIVSAPPAEEAKRIPATIPLVPKVPPPSGSGPIPLPQALSLDSDGPQLATEQEPAEVKATPRTVISAQQVSIDESLIQEIFVKNKKNYDKQLYIEFNPATRMSKVKFWTQDFVANELPTPYSLDEDSFLSIVAKTQKSYHGYLVKSSVTDRFFREVNAGQLPENITLVPVIHNDNVVGGFLGWGPKSTYNLVVLKDMEKNVQKLVLSLGWATPEAA